MLKRYSKKSAIDIFRLVCAALVVGIHFPPFTDLSRDFSYVITNSICRIAVPFFFMVSGFFCADKLDDKKLFWGQLKRLGVLYLAYSVIYLPIIVVEYASGEQMNVRSIFKEIVLRIFVNGTYYILWYYPALIGSLILLRILNRHFSPKGIILIGSVLYIFGVLMNYYKKYIVDISPFNVYFSIFPGTQNALFCGLFLVALGYFASVENIKINRTIALSAATVLFCILFLEIYVVSRYLGKPDGFGMSFCIVPISYLIFLVIKDYEVKYSRQLLISCRKMSTFIYGIHLFVGASISILLGYLNIRLFSPLKYCVILSISSLLAYETIVLSRKETFRILRYLF